ncbi:hypothetical protein BGZ94_000876 [Podila epigama]|nr:hypothetical protein BGZ94_000876 [Podila epigama]
MEITKFLVILMTICLVNGRSQQGNVAMIAVVAQAIHLSHQFSAQHEPSFNRLKNHLQAPRDKTRSQEQNHPPQVRYPFPLHDSTPDAPLSQSTTESYSERSQKNQHLLERLDIIPGTLSAYVATLVPSALETLRHLVVQFGMGTRVQRWREFTVYGEIALLWEPVATSYLQHGEAIDAIDALRDFTIANVRTLGTIGICEVVNRDGCLVGTVTYEFSTMPLPWGQRTIGQKNVTQLAKCGSNNICKGLSADLGHPYNKTEFAVPPKSLRPPSNAIGVCKRDVRGDMRSCLGTDTLLAGFSLHQGEQLISGIGSTLQVTKNGDVRLYNKKGKQYWSWGHNRSTKEGPFKLHLEIDGNLCLYNGKGVNYGCSNIPGTGLHGNYRYTLQNDGNAVVYDRAGKVITASNTDIFPFDGPVPCDGPLF